MNNGVHTRFDQDSTRNWSPDPEINMLYLTSVRNYMNDRLKARGHLFLNEIYDELGLSRTRQGQLVGWAFRSNDEGIDFWKGEEPNTGAGGGILLEFNVDGDILDKIEE